jgi:DNA polymerase-3 subunit alpha
MVEMNADLSGRDVIIGGVVAGTRTLSTRDGRAFLAAEIEDMTGSLEVTVWPETWEQTRDLWQPGNIVVTNVRVKARDERLQVSVQKAALYNDEAFDAGALLTTNDSPNGNGYRRNPNGNGGYRPKQPAPPPVAAPAPDTSGLRIILEETDDEDGDQERLHALVTTLSDYSGEGAVRLAIRQRDGEQIEMELPPARYCPELTQRLGDIIGPWGTVGA